MHNDLELTSAEKKYLKTWVNGLQQDKSFNITNHRDSMIPRNYSKHSLNKLSGEDIFALNQIPGVKFDREKHGNYALNEIVLELSHFIDEEAINRIELSIMSDNIK